MAVLALRENWTDPRLTAKVEVSVRDAPPEKRWTDGAPFNPMYVIVELHKEGDRAWVIVSVDVVGRKLRTDGMAGNVPCRNNYLPGTFKAMPEWIDSIARRALVKVVSGGK